MPAGVETARDLVGPAIAAAVARLSPEVRTVAAYHLGPATAAAARARRCVPRWRCCRRGPPGAAPERGVPAAVAVELVHNFSLLHDDIMDGDTERRHRPTAWTVFGVGAAILAGDALLALAQDILLEDTAAQGVWAARCLSAAVLRLIAGQGADLAFERRDDVTLAECLDHGRRQDRGADGLRVQHRRHPRRRARRAGHGAGRRSARTPGWPSSSPTTCWASGALPR